MTTVPPSSAQVISWGEPLYVAVPMPRRYVAEMIFDRVSASRVYKGENYTDDAPLQYFLASKDRSWYVNDVTKRQMEFLLRMWAVKGEDYTIRYIRDVFLRGRNRYR